MAGSSPLPEPVCRWGMVGKMTHNSLPKECGKTEKANPARPTREVLAGRPRKELRPWWGQLLVAGSPPLHEPVCRWGMVSKMTHNSFFLVNMRKYHACEDRIVLPHVIPLASTAEREGTWEGYLKSVRKLG